MDKLNLLLAIHCHQPVGNFDIVFSHAYEEAYLPFIDVLQRHPGVKISLHYSGALLDWLQIEHPEFLKRIKDLVKKGQVEILAGGYYEPVLSLIPQPDAQDQIGLLKARIKDLFSWNADGCWLTERVWEPKMPSILNKSGIKWTIVDDSHFKSAGLNSEQLSGYYISEDQGHPLAIFPASEKLRYLMPFKPFQETMDYLKNLHETSGPRCISFGDDGEKFGLWPGTNKWVYEEKWLDNLFSALEDNSSWLCTNTFSQYLEEHRATDRIYLNCASYREMMEWSDGFYRNFFLKYEEANWMHKRMLHVSQELTKIKSKRSSENKRLNQAQKHLFMAQTNDAYWHGVFGGLYLNHLRNTIYSNLISAEKLINGSKSHSAHVSDLNCDGQEEIVLSSDELNCILLPYQGAVLRELDYKPKSLNLINTLMRREEAYHQKIKQAAANVGESCDQPKSIHDSPRVKQENLEKFLIYDLFPRCCGLDHFLDKQTNLQQFSSCEYKELGDFALGQYDFKLKDKAKNKIGVEFSRTGKIGSNLVKIVKNVSASNDNLVLTYAIKNKSENSIRDLFGVEFNLSVFDNQLSAASGQIKADCLTVHDAWNQVLLGFSSSALGSIWHFPVETVSDSESGIEKTYQELCLLFNWQLNIAPGSDWSVKLGLKIG